MQLLPAALGCGAAMQQAECNALREELRKSNAAKGAPTEAAQPANFALASNGIF
jgi:hypothetical protein